MPVVDGGGGSADQVPVGLLQPGKDYIMQVVTGAADGTLKLWDIRKKTSLTYDKHKGKVWALAVSSQGQQPVSIVSGGNDGVMLFWRDSTKSTREAILQAN